LRDKARRLFLAIALLFDEYFIGSELFMTDAFRSPQLTLLRAQHHISNFKETVDKVLAERTCFIDKDSDPGKELFKVKFMQRLPEMLPCILFDATNNLRAVLDQAGYASAVAAKSPSLKNVKFPFGPTEEKFRNNLAGRSKDLPAEIRDLFGRSKAYQGENDTLWALNEIANADKHLALKRPVIGSAFYSATISDDKGTSDIVSPGGSGIGWDPEKYEMTLLSAPGGSKFEVNETAIAFDVSIEGIETLDSKPPTSALDSMCNEVRRLLEATEAECRRLFKPP
jgi:hypothetical protein